MMKKSEFVAAIAKKSNLTQKQADAALAATLDVIKEELEAGEKVQLTGFGTFSVRERAAREGRNPITGEKINIAASKSVAFKAGTKLKGSL